jgi:replicative DNA helicase
VRPVHNPEGDEVLIPASRDTERTILGAIMLDNRAINEAAESMSPSDFFYEGHRRIFARMLELHEKGVAIDIITLSEALGKRREVEAVGGIAYISSLIDGVPHQPSIADYVSIVTDASDKRRMVASCQSAITRLCDLDSTEDVMNDLQKTMLTVVDRDLSDRDVSVMDTARTIYNNMWNLRNGKIEVIGRPTGLGNLDEMITGYRDKELTIIGAWPSHGKSALMVQGAEANATQGTTVGCISMEMSREALLKRMVAMRAKIDLQKFRDPRFMSASELENVGEQLAHVGKLPLLIDDKAGLTVPQLKKSIKAMIIRGAKLIFVDYLQRMGAEAGQDDRQKVGLAALVCADLSKEHSIPIVALSQLARPDGRTPNTLPTMFYLKESGDCEAHADNVALIYRPRDGEGRHTGEDQIIVDKQREGPTGPINVHFIGRYATFQIRDWEREQAPAPLKAKQKPIEQMTLDAKGAASGNDK